jgi:hypothetical protein
MLLATACEDSCFAGSTLIATPRGPRAIRELAIGDEVWSYDHVERHFAVGKVTAIHRARGAIRSLHTAAGVLSAVTDSHPLFVVTNGAFVAAAAIQIGATLLHWNGDPESVPAPTQVIGFDSPAPGDTVEVFNLTVGEAFSTFFADGVFVHNKEYWRPPPCADGPIFALDAPATVCVGTRTNVRVWTDCEATPEQLDGVVLATSDPSRIVFEGRAAIAVGAGTVTIVALVDGKPHREATITVQDCASDAAAGDTSAPADASAD